MTGSATPEGGTGLPLVRQRPGSPGHLAAMLVVAVAYYVGARLGLNLSLVGRNVTPLWPPTGVAVAAFLILGRRTWPGVTVASLAVNLPINTGLIASLIIAAGNTVAPLLAATLLLKVGFRRQLDSLKDALAIVFLAALGSMLVSAVIGSSTLALTGVTPRDRFLTAFAVWWTGDAMGVLVVTPFLLALPLYRELPRWSGRQWLEAAAILVVTTGAVTWATTSHVHGLFLTLPVLGWASWRLQLRGAAPAALLASALATWSAARERGPFEGFSLFEQMFTLQAFNACVALTSFFLAALVSERMRSREALEAAARDLELRVEARTADLTAANVRLLSEIRQRSAAQEALVHEEARTLREHEIAETLQRSMLPERLPDIPGVEVAARYVPATADVKVGGDWYDVLQLPGGLVGLAIGDVAGHGLPAAATMAQLRMALRAYALQDPAPASVLQGVQRLVAGLPSPEMVTLLYAVHDPATGRLRYSNAGHPPALVVTPTATGGSRATFLRGALAPPIGVTVGTSYAEASHELPPGATLLLYTDGLVERRGHSLDECLDRLAGAATSQLDDVDALCDRLLSELLETDQVADDVALVAMRPTPVAAGPLVLTLPAEARMLVSARAALRQWLRDVGVDSRDEDEILIACGEACANVVQHAYRGAPGTLELEARLEPDSGAPILLVTVRDEGQWRPAGDRGGGWGQQLMRGLMTTVDIEHSATGTEVRLTRRLGEAAAR